MEKIKSKLLKLTFDNLRGWAGESVFNRGRKYITNVDGLSRTSDGNLAAWVSGTETYATSVNLADGESPGWFCTCPYNSGPCKHAVAVVLTAAEFVKRKEDIPLLRVDDDLYETLFEDQDAGVDSDILDRKSADSDDLKRIKIILSEKTKAELVSLFLDFAGRNANIRRIILENEQLEKGQANGIVKSLRKEIEKVTGESAWRNHWDDEGHLPDYSGIREKLQALLDKGYADEVVQLGDELWESGSRQIEESDDDGDVAGEVSECMEIVLQAIQKSSMAPSEQILWVIDRMLADEFDILDTDEIFFDDGPYKQPHWREVAEELESRLKSFNRTDSRHYSRQALLNQLLDAYELSGWQNKVIPLMEKEVDACKNYDDLVKKLLEAGEKEKARYWCKLGFERTINDLPGIASRLQNKLRGMAFDENRYDLVASYLAQDFFHRPSMHTYVELIDAAEKAGCRSAVREAAVRYLETGIRPDIENSVGKDSVWPLPEPEVIRPVSDKRASYETFPDLNVLIDIAILEKRLDDVVDLHRSLQKIKYRSMDKDRAVANAVAKTHPQVALDIWRAIIDGYISQVKPKAYEEAAVYMRLMRKVYDENKRMDEWQALIDELRKTHKPKRKLMEILDMLMKNSII